MVGQVNETSFRQKLEELQASSFNSSRKVRLLVEPFSLEVSQVQEKLLFLSLLFSTNSKLEMENI